VSDQVTRTAQRNATTVADAASLLAERLRRGEACPSAGWRECSRCEPGGAMDGCDECGGYGEVWACRSDPCPACGGNSLEEAIRDGITAWVLAKGR